MKVLFATSEAVPFCKTGGLADVAGSLPQALAVYAELVDDDSFNARCCFRHFLAFLD